MKLVLTIAWIAGFLAAGCSTDDIPDHPDPFNHREEAKTPDSGGGSAEVRVQAEGFSFSPSTLTSAVGRETTLILENLDDTEHDFQIDEIDAEIIGSDPSIAEHGSEHSGAALAVHSEAGESSSVTFKTDDPGSYEFYCTITGHKDAGMVGTLIVE
jgi:uncharacterized cupredoxin-like copper-binding protein